MKFKLIVIICVCIDVSYSCNRTAIKESEDELKQIVTNTSDTDFAIRLRKTIQILNFECKIQRSPLENVSQQCWYTTFRCNGEGYVPGCPCWTYEIDYRNATTTRLNFNQFHPNGSQVATHGDNEAIEENLLRKCDRILPPWDWYYVYKEHGGLTEFGHCLKGEDIDCFCSSIRSVPFPYLIEKYKPENDMDYQNKVSSCDKSIKYNCNETADRYYCPCWVYNVVNEESEVNVTSDSLPAQSTAGSSVKVDAVLCDKPYLNCDDERVALGCKCWEYEIFETGPSITGFELVPKYKQKSKANERAEFYRKNCRHDDLPSSRSPTEATYFVHCKDGGHIHCYCSDGWNAHVLSTSSCPAGFVKIGKHCVRNYSGEDDDDDDDEYDD